jgi:predicted ATP-dependent endonuclease of OLD family
MHLQRVQVPDFRVLKDIDISFEKEFSPRIFPLGSLNGGGKSTLLQLIFILLHCSATPEKHEFIRNLLENFEIPDGSNKRVVAEFEIWDGEKKVNLEYFLLPKDAFEELLESYTEKIKIESFSELSEEEEVELVSHLMDDAEEEAKKRLQTTKGLKYIVRLSSGRKSLNQILCCQFRGIKFEQIDWFLVNLSKRIFLGSTSTQIFLFLSKEYRKLLFKKPNLRERIKNPKVTQELTKEWEEAKKKITNFFSYDFVSVDVLIESFKQARDKDFEEAIETGGHYGKHYQNLLSDFNKFLKDKQINLDKDLSGVNFKAERNGEIIELYPEDLSHGELKRLSLYVWLKYSNIENAIILFDEIEIALHPDWQYQIIRDLEEWGPTNQYILATHSYELCQALTPAHVKEIEPKLLNKINN